MIGILDYGIGNTKAIANLLNIAEIPNQFLSDIDVSLKNIAAIILPGVGSFDPAIHKLKSKQYFEFIKESKDVTPIIGICLGMQLLFENSEEGVENGLGILPGVIRKIQESDNVGIPNCGWREITTNVHNEFLEYPTRYYFNHSYSLRTSETNLEVSYLQESSEIVASVQQDNIFGFQFHPERSHQYGISLFQKIYQKL